MVFLNAQQSTTRSSNCSCNISFQSSNLSKALDRPPGNSKYLNLPLQKTKHDLDFLPRKISKISYWSKIAVAAFFSSSKFLFKESSPIERPGNGNYLNLPLQKTKQDLAILIYFPHKISKFSYSSCSCNI